MTIDFITRKNETKALIAILFITLFIYLNHFNNPFFFDDYHTIVENESIRSLDNWIDFFTSADTFSSLPANRSYRPMITLKNALDYQIAGGLNFNYYHYHIFFWFLALIILVFLLSKKVYQSAIPNNNWISITALFASAWFAFHTANAETINYICARSDSFTALCVVASLLLYIHPIGKKWHLYLLTMIIGIWTKQTGVMFFPILFVYIILFEEHSLLDNFKVNAYQKTIRVLKKVAPTAIIASSLFIFNQYYLTPEATDSTNFTVTRFEYISTQFYVTLHYLGNFILPINLSADPDITIIKPWYDIRIILGFLIVSGMIFAMLKTALRKELRPISFGIAWFFIALLPTAINPLFQIANDHRMFFPFIGLFISVPWSWLIIVKKYNLSKKITNYPSIMSMIIIFILATHSYGTIQRNKVWNSNESLWKDVVKKSPENPRGLMNYGIDHMEKGNYDDAIEYFNRAYKLQPNYCLLHVNLGIVNGAKKNYTKAEQYFKSALNFNITSPAPEYFYARHLVSQNKYAEAKHYLEQALNKSPNHSQSKQLLNSISEKIISPQEQIKILEEKIRNQPQPELYIDLSLIYYKMGKFKMVISVCEELLKIDPNNTLAYNNICSAYNKLSKWKSGAEACKKALEIKPDFQLAKNNLKWAQDNIPEN